MSVLSSFFQRGSRGEGRQSAPWSALVFLQSANWLLVGVFLGLLPFKALADPQCPPEIEWQKSFGNSVFTTAARIAPCSDGGFAVGSYTREGASGNMTCDGFGGIDGWVAKFDAKGQELWRTCLGGSSNDFVIEIKGTADRGFLVALSSSSGPSGNRTAPLTQPGSFGHDCWIVRLDPDGRILWDKSLGPRESNVRICSTRDRSYLAVLDSRSPPGGIKTALAYGGLDYWLVRLDDLGNKVWDVSFGGKGDDAVGEVLETADGGFMIVGSSNSPLSGNKSAPNLTEPSSTSLPGDYWVVRVDSQGRKLWDAAYGSEYGDGCSSIALAEDGGFLLGGSSHNLLGGFPRDTDYCVVRINSEGKELWRRYYGGQGFEELNSLALLPDGGYVLGGRSQTNGVGNRLSLPLGKVDTDYWIARTSNDGEKLWELALGGNGTEDGGLATVLRDGSILFWGTSGSRPSGNRSEPRHGEQDIWIVKLGPEKASAGASLCASFLEPSTLQSQGFRFRVAGPTSLTYQVESAVDLIHWESTGQILFGTNLVEQSDPNLSKQPQRFFRARAQDPR